MSTAGVVNVAARAWLRTYTPRPLARIRLVCFPHAGGNATFYRTWASALPAEVEVLAVQYPGRLDRIAEPCLDDMEMLADVVADLLRPVLTAPVALFGHSMGASVAYEVACRIERRCGLTMRHLFVSGRPAPRHHRPGRKHLGSDDALWDEMRRLGGTGDAALDHPELRAAITPALRGDYRLIETYWPRPAPPLRTPVSAFVGDDDSEALVDEVADWNNYTSGGFALNVFDGNHFYLVPHRARVLDAVVRSLGVEP